MSVVRASIVTLCLAAASWPAIAAGQTWAGQVSDSMCGLKHEAPAEGGPELSPHDCTLACVKGGSKFVFVTGGKVFQIANQSLPLLSTLAGEDVTLTGELVGDTITVSAIEKATK
ncbi:MAG: hypothetical protein U0Q12_23865 [Vicinamibacterales bacterium]